MTFKEKFAALCEEYNVVFDVSDRKDIVLRAVAYPDGVPYVKETIEIKFNEYAECCEFVVDKME